MVGERGAYSLVQAPGALQVPATVQAIIAARIDRLDPEEKRVLQAAAVIGTDVTRPLLLAIADEAEAVILARLGRLSTAGLLIETSAFPEPEWSFVTR